MAAKRSASLSRASGLLLTAALSAALSLSLTACSGARARPSQLADAAQAQRSPQAEEASRLAPTSFAEAEKLKRDAEAAFDAGDSAGSAILAEQAVAAYARAFVHARSARAGRAFDEAKGELTTAEAELGKLREEQARVAAEVNDLETRTKVARDALPVASSEPAGDAKREQARGEAARALATDARLLCVATRLLAPETPGLKEAEADLASLDKALSGRPAPIDQAARTRASCLASLTAARRQAARTQGADEADALLSELSREGSFSPVRDDRGVVVALHDAFAGDGLSKEAQGKLEKLANVARAHAQMPLLVVVHDAERADPKRDEARAEAAKKALGRDKGAAVDRVLAGATRPIADPKSAKDRGRNERLEIVFVDRGSAGG